MNKKRAENHRETCTVITAGFVALLFLFFLFSVAKAFGSETKILTTHTSKLSAIIQKIHVLEDRLSQFRQQKETIKNDLENTEITIGETTKKIKRTESQLKQQQQLLTQYEQKLATYYTELEQQKKLLAEQLQASYQLGHQPYLKILLNQQDPVKIARYLRYYALLHQARLRIIISMQKTTLQMESMKEQIKEHTGNLQSMRLQQKKQNESLQYQRNQREHLLKKTNLSIETNNQQLQKLLASKRALENIIMNLQKQAAASAGPGQQFQTMQSKLLWPIDQGRIVEYYGQPLAGGLIRSTGTLIQAPEGIPVHAVYPGKVIFADWLKGFGLLTIVQHGANYMTLYGRNQSLYVKTGETVAAGQTIATVGNSGGFVASALYFEIRYKGKPINPASWLRKR